MMSKCHYCNHALISTCSSGLHITCKKTGSDYSNTIMKDCVDYTCLYPIMCENNGEGAAVIYEPEFFNEEEFAV